MKCDTITPNSSSRLLRLTHNVYICTAGTILESINSIHDNEMGLVLTRLVFPNAICNTSQSKSVGHSAD
jgi:hypothetical protein